MDTRTPRSWRAILQQIIQPTGERGRLASVLKLSPVTLTRWAKGETQPQKTHLMRLVAVVSSPLREELQEAIKAEYADVTVVLDHKSNNEISSAFIGELLSERTSTLDSHRLYRLSALVLERALAMLDPHQEGIAVTIAQCMPPSEEHGGKIYSLRERGGRGTYPWPHDLEPELIFLGAESLGGYAAEHGRVVNVPDLSKQTMFPVHRTEHEVSAAACPIMLGGQVAGCLSASSCQLAYFTPERMDLLETFSYLASLAFSNDEFYSLGDINLQMMPHQKKQFSILGKFRPTAAAIQEEGRKQGRSIRNAEAELQAWRQIENELIDLATKNP